MYVPVAFQSIGEKLHPRLRGTNSVTRYVFSEGSWVIPKKATHMDDETWAKVVTVVAPGIIRMKVGNVACAFIIILSIYLTLHLCPYKLSSDDL